MASLMLIAIVLRFAVTLLLSQFLGICSFLGVSKKTETAAGMGGAVVFVITIASFVAGLLYKFILVPTHFEYLKTIVFILVIAALVQIVEMFLKKFVPYPLQGTWCIPSSDHNKLCSSWCSTEQRLNMNTAFLKVLSTDLPQV